MEFAFNRRFPADDSYRTSWRQESFHWQSSISRWAGSRERYRATAWKAGFKHARGTVHDRHDPRLRRRRHDRCGARQQTPL